MTSTSQWIDRKFAKHAHLAHDRADLSDCDAAPANVHAREDACHLLTLQVAIPIHIRLQAMSPLLPMPKLFTPVWLSEAALKHTGRGCTDRAVNRHGLQ